MHPQRSWLLVSPVFRALLALTVLITGVAQPAAVSAQPAPRQAEAQATQQATEIGITAGGFQPTVIEVDAGQPVHFTNVTSQQQTVTHDGVSSGGTVLFDSGPILRGGGFSLALLAPGDHALRSTANEDGWLREYAQQGRLALAVARQAAAAKSLTRTMLARPD